MQTDAVHLLHDFSQFAALAFVAGLWQGLAMVVAIGLWLRMLPRLSAAVRFAVWAFAFALMAILPLLHFSARAGREPLAPSAPIHVGAAWGFAIAAIWLALMAWRIGQLGMHGMRLRRIWGRATPVEQSGVILGILRISGRNATLCTSADVDSPSVIGFIAPRLLVPEWMFARLTTAELQQVVLHECEHLRRGDDWMNLLQKIALAIFPLHPALLWVDRRLGLERELACDAGVVASIAKPLDYAHCLTRLAEHRMVRRRVALSLSAWGRQSELAHRVQTLLRPMRSMSTRRARASMAMLGLVLTAGSLEMARVPRFISFENAISTPAAGQAAARSVNTAPARVVLADYHPHARQSHPQFFQADLPLSGRRQHSVTSHSSAMSLPLEAALPRPNSRRKRPQPRVLLTGAIQSRASVPSARSSRRQAHAIYTLKIDFSPSYAAVPFGNGWLFIQL